MSRTISQLFCPLQFRASLTILTGEGRAISRIEIQEALSSEAPPVSWLVREFLSAGTFVLLAGAPGVGKSILSYRLAMCVASGLPFLGFPACDPQRVLYIDEENAGQDCRAYIRRNWIGLGTPRVQQLIDNLRVEHFSMPGRRDEVYATLATLAREHGPSLIVIDTAGPVCRLQDENDNAEASIAIRGLRAVRGAAGPNCVMLVLKHARLMGGGNDGEQGHHKVRGASAWIGETDATLIFRPLHTGRPRKDGLRETVLEPDKVRAFGLGNPLRITPAWNSPDRSGLLLSSCTFSTPENP